MRGVRISASLVVRDEADLLRPCLESLRGIVDEIVVYDTGSSDGTREIATAAGATVIAGSWHDDFSRARNAALDACQGDWVLSLDADERVVAGPAEQLRNWLGGNPGDIGTVGLVDTRVVTEPGPSGWYDQRRPRLFRRDGARWVGATAERVTYPAGLDRTPRARVPVDVLRVYADHSAESPALRSRAARRVVIGLLEVARRHQGQDTDALAAALLDLGSNLLHAGRRGHGMQSLVLIRRLSSGGRVWGQATDLLALSALDGREYTVALSLADELAADGCDAGYCAWLSARALLGLGRDADALAALQGVGATIDPAGRRYPHPRAAELRAFALRMRNDRAS